MQMLMLLIVYGFVYTSFVAVELADMERFFDILGEFSFQGSIK